MGTMTYVDSRSLEELQETQRFASVSIMNVVAHVSEFFDSQIKAMEEQKKEMDIKVESAILTIEKMETRHECCCRDQQRWRLFFNMHYKYRIKKAYNKWRKLKIKNDLAAKILSDCKHELSLYRQKYGGDMPPGGESLMRHLANEHTDAACAELNRLRKIIYFYEQPSVKWNQV